MRLSPGAVALAAVAALAGAGAALAATPAQMLARSLRPEMQSYYDRHDPGTRITAVACTLNAGETRATCDARFTIGRLEGVFVVDATIDRATGNVTTRTASATCRNAATGAGASCF